MAFLRLANTEDKKRYYYEGTEEYIVLRTELTKKEASGLLKFAPRKEDDLDGGLRFIAKAFKDLITEWSLEDAEGNPLPPTVETYELLDQRAASWIDSTVGNHLRSVLGTEAEEAEKKD